MRDAKQPEHPKRPIRSYVLRQGRLTAAQSKALERLWPVYGIPPGAECLDFRHLFGRHAPVIAEIGFGNGEALAAMAREAPDTDFVGIEVHQPGIGHLLRMLDAESLRNVRVANVDAVEFLRERVPDASLSAVRIWFPDPWPKKRHHKRRLIQPDFIRLLGQKLVPGAIVHLATDWLPYAEHMLAVLQADDGFENLSATGTYCARPAWRPQTRFERRGARLGHETRDLLFRRCTARPSTQHEPGP